MGSHYGLFLAGLNLLCKLQSYWIHRNLTSFVSQINDIHDYVQYKNIVYKTKLKKLLDAN